MLGPDSDHYATLGLDRECSETHIRTAYRLLAKQYHPDVNGGNREAQAKTQALNAAYEILGDPERRREYDGELAARQQRSPRTGSRGGNVSQDMLLRLDELLRGTTLQVRIRAVAGSGHGEIYELVVPPDTAPGSRFRIARTDGGWVTVRVKAQPDGRFKVRGADVRCDLQISFDRAQKGGAESLRGLAGEFLRVTIPARVKAGEVIRISGAGLPKAAGARGDLLVRVMYRPEVRITRAQR